MKLTKKTKKLWFLNACYKGKPIMNKHHIVPKHHGGETSELVEVTLLEHALAHLEIYNNTGCKTCYNSYKTIMGQHNEWVRIQKLFNDNVHYDIIDYDKDVRDKKHKNKHPYKQMCFREPMDFADSVNDVLDKEAEELIYKESEYNLKDEIQHALDTLKDRERKVLEMFFGINNGYTFTLEEIADKFLLTIERTRQIKEKAIRRLRHPSRSESLKVHL
jgi:RNA polymerase sigma factor (sigma-70 family)